MLATTTTTMSKQSPITISSLTITKINIPTTITTSKKTTHTTNQTLMFSSQFRLTRRIST